MIRIGTSGWHYDHWRGSFYSETCSPADMLSFYAGQLDTVEINNSFYRMPTAETFGRWREQTPEGFCFAVKASRFITHNKKLRDPEATLGNFLPQAERLCEKMGPILFQLPPTWTLNLERLEQFLSALPKGKRRPYAFEFRNPTWQIPEVYRLLRRHNAAFCIFDLAGFQTPLEITADWSYIRLHGPGNKYQGSYSALQLRAWAERLLEWTNRLQSIFVYFDNDQQGFAARNALTLKDLVGKPHPSSKTSAKRSA